MRGFHLFDLRVGSYVYPVYRDATRVSHATRGVCDCNQHVIELQDNLPFMLERVVAMHEASHAALDHAGWRQGAGEDEKKSDAAPTYTVEQFLDGLMPGLLGVLRDNPAFVLYLLEESPPR